MVEGKTVVIDNGSGIMKVGLSGEYAPKYKYPTVIVSPEERNILLPQPDNDYFVGFQALSKKELGRCRYPIEHGMITDFNLIEKVWFDALYNKATEFEKEKRVMMTESPLTPKAIRERATQIMFETFESEYYYVALSSVLSLYASGRTTGVVLDSGAGVSHTVPVYEGFVFLHNHGIQKLDFAGRDLDSLLSKYLQEKDIRLRNCFSVAEYVKKKYCYVALDFDNVFENLESTVVDLPDGEKVEVAEELFNVPEALFKPSIFGSNQEGIVLKLNSTINSCDTIFRSKKLSNIDIVLAGGSTCFNNFSEKIQQEMKTIQNAWSMKVIAPPERNISGWTGGSILSSLSTFQNMCIIKEEYEENGPDIVNRKCF